MRISSSRASFSGPRLSLGLELVGGGVCAFSHFQGFAKLPSSMKTTTVRTWYGFLLLHATLGAVTPLKMFDIFKDSAFFFF